MTYSIVTIRESDDLGDDRLYPELAMEPDRVVRPNPGEEPVVQYWGTGLTVEVFDGRRHRTIVELDEHPIEVLITGARVTIGCAKFDKGGGWSGSGGLGLVVATTANVVSHRRAAKRQLGKALVGHIRYPWLHTVGAVAKTGWGTASKLRLGVQRHGGEGGAPLSATITLLPHLDPLALSQYIVQRGARWRLAHDNPLTDEERARLALLAQAELLPNEPGAFATYTMPTYYPVSGRTATLPSAP